MQYYKLVASLAEVDAAAARKKTFGEKAVFRKELTNYNRVEVVMEMQHLKEYPHTPSFLFFLRRLGNVSTEILFDCSPLFVPPTTAWLCVKHLAPARINAQIYIFLQTVLNHVLIRPISLSLVKSLLRNSGLS